MIAQTRRLISVERVQYQVFIGLSLGAAGLVGIACLSDSRRLSSYFDNINPLITVAAVIFLGAVALSVLLSRGWFSICVIGNGRGLIASSCAAVPFGLAAILIDLKVVFPEDFNVKFPLSLAFYPAMGYMVEIVFHVLPLACLLIVTASLFGKASHSRAVWLCILGVSLLEPAYQAAAGVGRLSTVAEVYVGVHVLLINLAQLYIFKRYDFVSMYLFRVVYYLMWHIAWGYIRLSVLF